MAEAGPDLPAAVTPTEHCAAGAIHVGDGKGSDVGGNGLQSLEVEQSQMSGRGAPAESTVLMPGLGTAAKTHIQFSDSPCSDAGSGANANCGGSSSPGDRRSPDSLGTLQQRVETTGMMMPGFPAVSATHIRFSDGDGSDEDAAAVANAEDPTANARDSGGPGGETSEARSIQEHLEGLDSTLGGSPRPPAGSEGCEKGAKRVRGPERSLGPEGVCGAEGSGWGPGEEGEPEIDSVQLQREISATAGVAVGRPTLGRRRMLRYYQQRYDYFSRYDEVCTWAHPAP